MRLLFALSLALATPALAQPAFVAFESGPVRPLALSPDRSRLFAVDTPDNHLEVYDVGDQGLTHAFSVPVGMEPVAVAARSNTEVWVVNHLSDSVSIVDLASVPPKVVRTLIVGDEPRDIVFAGTANRAFISTAHRGQQRTHSTISGVTGAGNPQLTTPGVGRADVWVFDPANPGNTMGGTPVRILSFFADTPRALAKSADGNTVYLAAFHSGNRTTGIFEPSVCNGFDAAGTCAVGSATAPGGVPGPDDNAAGDPAPETGVIVKFDAASGQWRDVLNRNWTSLVRFSLPDNDVFAFNANTFTAGTVFSGVGTILFNMAVNPVSGKLYVTNTESPNQVRFEGPGVHGGSTVQGHLSETRISVLDPGSGGVNPQHLNRHIDYGALHTDAGANHAAIEEQKPHSLATPLQPVVSGDGATVYMAAFGSAKIGVFPASTLESASFETLFDPTAASASYIDTAGGPAGLALDEPRGFLYVLTRFDNAVSVVHLASRTTVQSLPMHNPEPASVVEGRPFLYDAAFSSGNGEASCASCHIFGDFDSLAWDLGNPDDVVTSNPQPVFPGALAGPSQPFHPMKGPMTTQTLRGLATHGGMHWRGDRTNGFFGADDCSDATATPCNEDLSFRNFIVAFEGLLGHQGLIAPADMQAFSDFMLQVFLPPNPVRALDNTLTAAQQAGLTKYLVPSTDGNQASCNECHMLDPANGLFGTNGDQAFEGEPQTAKVAHLRNAYQKVGMFGISAAGGINLGNQVRGFGFLHDGSVDTVFNFLSGVNFVLNNTEQSNLEQLVLAFDTDLAPIVGQQVTLRTGATAPTTARVDLIVDRGVVPFSSLTLGGAVTECDVVVKGSVGGDPRGWVLNQGTGQFQDDVGGTISEAALRALVDTQGPLTFTAVPPGSGLRMGIDRDLDADLDGNDNCPDVANPDQLDTDSNGVGDACQTIPEPGHVAMLVSGALLLAALKRRSAR
jgi:YVTN family beta-propeller protein